MKLHGKTYWILLAAIAGLPLMAGSAFAQQRVGSDGHALDANNRVGSGGINVVNVGPMPTASSIGNNIVTDNTTGLYGFHGKVGYANANAFSFVLPGSGVDQFSAASAGVPSAGAASNYLIGPQPYYGASNTATPPPGFVSNNLNTGFIPSQPTPQGVQDLRLGQQPLDSSITTLPMPGILMEAGPVDPNAQRSMIEASPLYGVRQWQTNAQGDLINNQTITGPDETALANQNNILEIRRQLRQNVIADNNNGALGNAPSQAGPLSPAVPLTGTQALPPLGNSNDSLSQSSISPTAGDVSTGQSSRRYLPLPTPAQQSVQYLELRNRLMQYDSGTKMNDEQANRAYTQALKDLRILQLGGTPDKANAANGDHLGGASSMAPGKGPADKPGAKAIPLRIPTMAAGMKSSAMADLLTQAEDEIRHQQFDKAIATYNEAGAAAPNNPLILIGRANAELAGSYYKQAESDIRTAIKQDKALLMAQFNLNELYGARFEYVVTQLKQVASDSPKDSTPLFLLAYLSYNADNPGKAQAYLDGANKLTGGHDDIIGLMKDYWTFNEKIPTTQPDQLNK